jgi:Holliday junction DNA helicase RuvB
VIARAGDLAALLIICSRDVLFIDEIHRLNPAVEDYSSRHGGFPADLTIGEGRRRAPCASIAALHAH